MNDSDINLTITVDEHEILTDMINSYFDIVDENLPLGIKNKLDENDPCLVRFNALSGLREKVFESWKNRFPE